MKASRRQFLAGLGSLSLAGPHQAPPTAAEFVASDPARVGRTGRPQLVEFYHPLKTGCRKAQPIVHGLEREFRGRVTFLYLHVAEARNAAVKARLGFKSTPHVVLLNAYGAKVREFVGGIDAEQLRAALQALSAAR